MVEFSLFPKEAFMGDMSVAWSLLGVAVCIYAFSKLRGAE